MGRIENIQDFETNNFYNDVVNEMEEILLETTESPATRLHHCDGMIKSKPSLDPVPSDDGLATSTCSAGDSHPQSTHARRIDGVEVIGAKLRKEDISLSERLVGVKEYTVYVIKVWRGREQWEAECRYRNFCALHHQLKALSKEEGWILPPIWSSVEKESKKIFGNVSPDVVSERRILIQSCLRSIVNSDYFSSLPRVMVSFLCGDSFPRIPVSVAAASEAENAPSFLGKTISLIVETRGPKPRQQVLEAQNYSCAGCHQHFDVGSTQIQNLVQIFRWGQPRLCEYTGQLFCCSCHSNETAVLPARVLHYWDFSQYPVSQLAKSFLDSIYEQPVLCVSAVNAFPFSKVPSLRHVAALRKEIETMLCYIHCPFLGTISNGLGSRRYLLEGSDLFALRDLCDLSKGPFSGLIVVVETVLNTILEHITERCLVCCDAGLPCGARLVCDDPSSLIFPFQETVTRRCKSCSSVFHKHCFGKVSRCSCGASLEEEGESPGGSASGLAVRSLLSMLFSKTTTGKD